MRTTSNSFGLRRRPRLIEFLSPRMVFLLASDGVTTNFSNFRIFLIALAKIRSNW